MGCCGSRQGDDDDHDDNRPRSPSGDPKKPPPTAINKNKRNCTNLPFLVLFLAAWAAIWIVYAQSIKGKANYKRLLRGVDLQNRICGVDPGVEDKMYAAWPWVYPMGVAASDYKTLYDIKTCVSSCNETMNIQNGSIILPYPSKKVYYYCVPNFDQSQELAKQLFANFGATKVGSYFTSLVGDLITGLPIVISSFFVSIFGGIMFIMLCHKFAKFLTWLVMFLVVSSLFTVAYFLVMFDSSSNFLNTEQTALFEKSVHYLGYAVAIAAEFILIFIVMLRKRIEIAVEIVREASKAMKDMPLIFFIPIIFFGIAGGYTIFWIYIALNIFSVTIPIESKVPQPLVPFLGFSTYKDNQWNEDLRNFLGFHFFHYLWFVQFLKYASYLTISGALADWYFTKTDAQGNKVTGENDDELSPRPVWKSLVRMIRYNTGTVAFASMIIAIIQFIRALVTYLEKNAIASGNPIQRMLLCVLQCFLKCFECCIDKLNKQALIYCSIYGSGLCKSGFRAFQISWKNLFRVAAVTMVTEFLMIVGKLTIAACTTALAILIYKNHPNYANMSSFLLPGLLIFIMSYTVASLILLLYEASIDCIFFCFLVDFENNKGEGMFASDELIAIVDKNAALSRKAALKRVLWREKYGDKYKKEETPKLNRSNSEYKSKSAIRSPPIVEDGATADMVSQEL